MASTTSETSTTSSNITSNAKPSYSSKEIKDFNKDTFLALKNQVTFAKQCMGLLHNQMKHAMDTLNILQDQVIKAQSTIDKLEGKQGSPTPSPKINSVVSVASGTEYHEQTEHSPGILTGQRMVVLDGSGQAMYAIEKPLHSHHIHEGPCPCVSCAGLPGIGHHVVVDGQVFPACTDQAGQVLVHPGGPIYPYAIPGTPTALRSPSKGNHKYDHESRQSNTENIVDTVKSSSSSSSSDNQAVTVDTPKHSKKSTKSSSPIATQLLQVIDVLNADDDDSDKIQRGQSHRLQGQMQSGEPFKDPLPYSIYSPPASRHGVGRRSRKQDMSPVKKEDSRHFESNATSLSHSQESSTLGMMRVPPPVLASTLEPEFLVVPGSSYFWESPTSGSDQHGNPGAGPSLGKGVEAGSGDDSLKAEVDGGQVCTSSITSQSQVSDICLSKSSSVSSNCEKSAARHSDNAGANSSADRRREEMNVVFCGASSVRHNGGPTISSVCSIATATCNVPTDSPVIKDPVMSKSSKSSPLNSAFPQLTDPQVDVSAVTRVTRAHKPSPLNSLVTSADTEVSQAHMTRSTALRASHASPLNSLIVGLQSGQSSTDTVSTALRQTPAITHAQADNAADKSHHVPAYSLAQISGSECTSARQNTTKKPNILNRNRHNKQDIPEGIVVLVPTIEDAKKLIHSTGSNKDTPVLVPQNILNTMNGTKGGASEGGSSLGSKRPHPSQGSFESSVKRINTGAVIID
ncbi:uncharacterized serine-rich protein C215.13 isoform X1 [Nematostella vectensis]|uniref:uncharacterized serine-rich protein C215.13 isoform X1 n=1 Tax=Nematostella vectensis TaxID=45351 RepID=UPI002076DE82|nr:uncharacterized serine-rich protein C215.13 isoform X1 [Nematostella vectensis]